MPTGLHPFANRFLPAGLFCLILIDLSIAFLDRPLSSWSHEHFHDVVGFVWLTWIAEVPAPLAAIVLIGVGVAAVCGWRPGRWGRVLIACGLATVAALAIKEQLKFAFGRTWPETWTHDNPSWIGNGVFGFEPFHGGPGWTSFPSGHTTAIAAPMAVLWHTLPRWRWLWATMVGLVAIGLLGADYHWLSDTIAGAYLGGAVGFGILSLLSPAAPAP
jgi:membrane-associated phospholipid phosphatase